jgi:hypothetical protein
VRCRQVFQPKVATTMNIFSQEASCVESWL